MADFENLLIGRILFSGELRSIVDRQIHQDMFSDNRNKKVFGFLMYYHQKYGQLPPIEVVAQEFPDYKIPHAKEPADYCIDKLIDNYIRNKSSDILLGNVKKLVNNPLKGLEDLKREFSRLDIETNPTKDTNYLDSTDKRKQKYLDMRELKGLDGYPTPWDVLNECTMGLHAEDFVVIVARPKVGKTWMLCIFAEYAWREGLRVLFISNEMSARQIEQRIDAIHFKLPHKSLRAGLLADSYEQAYLEGLDRIKGADLPPIWIVGTVGGTSAISTKIDEYKPDLVLVDGLYLMPDDKRGLNRWERVSNISRDLKLLAKIKKLPIVATTQFNRMADDTKMSQVSLNMLGFSDSIGQDSDVVLGMFSNKDMQLNREMLIRTLAIREGEPKDFTLMWDLHGMDFKVLSSEDDSQVIEDGELKDDEIDF